MIDKILSKLKKEWQNTLKNFGIKPKEKPTMMLEQSATYEINLVPEVKRQMIKAMRFRNIMLFACIILVSVFGGAVIVSATIWEGQNIAMSSQDAKLSAMSKKIKSFSSLSEFLTIQNQLDDLNTINSDKKVLSRVFPILSVILPSGPDTIQLSELSVDLSTSSLRFDGQADAKVAPFYDYRVLESFTKGIALMKYDFGRYVTEDGQEIPTRCMVETTPEGNLLIEEVPDENNNKKIDKYIYAYWLKGKKGCDPSRDDYATDELEEEIEEDEEEIEDLEDPERIQEEFLKKYDAMNDYEKSLMESQVTGGNSKAMAYADVVKIYRSPRFDEWYKEGYMDESGEISGVSHFASECIKYSGVEDSSGITWSSTNDCMLANGDVIIRDSSNGRDSRGELVLRFNATITFNEEVFKFTNKHMMAISPTTQNVTDSYLQIEGMFAERAADCADTDVVCTSAATNSSNSSSSNSSNSSSYSNSSNKSNSNSSSNIDEEDE